MEVCPTVMRSIVNLSSGTHSMIPGLVPLSILPFMRPDSGDEDVEEDLDDDDLDEDEDEDDLDDEDLDEDENLDEVDDVN